MERLVSLAAVYSAAAPFPHIVMDDFLRASEYRSLSEAFPGPDADIWYKFKTSRENKKLQSRDLAKIPQPLCAIINELNSDAFIHSLERLTGIQGLVADHDMLGGGLHQTLPGGRLGMHIDYNRHPKTKLHRRLNAILYLNDEWRDEWGGHLELWDRDVKSCVQRIAPTGNRLVVFSTSEHSWHGHPDPLACPVGVTRRSIALYYYSPEPAEESEQTPDHNTVFRERPGEQFKPTLRERISSLTRAIR